MLEQQMKRAISIFFILLANIAILAHAVVPHHHHNKVFAAIVNVLDDDAQKALNHSHDSETHHHGSNSEECAINETVVAAVFRLQKDNSFDSGSFDFDYQFDLFSADIVVGTPREFAICSQTLYCGQSSRLCCSRHRSSRTSYLLIF